MSSNGAATKAAPRPAGEPRRALPVALARLRPLLAAEWLAALVVSVAALFLFFNGSFFSTYNAYHVDLSINLTAAAALRQGQDPYGATTLAARAAALGGPTHLLYGQLFTSYIQPPTSALSLLPLTELPWRDATRLYLVFNHVFLFAAVGLTLYTVRPTLPLHASIAVVSVILMAYSQIYGSFALGQVDATILLFLALGFWGYANAKPAVTGAAIACAASIKLIPGLLLLYFLWKREYRAVLWAIGVGVALQLAALAYTGFDVYESYLKDMVPTLTNGSTQYTNASFGALIARAHTGDVIRGQSYLLYMDEIPTSTAARLAATGIGLAGLAALAIVIPRSSGRPAKRRSGDSDQAALDDTRAVDSNRHDPRSRGALHRLAFEYYLVIAVGLLISSVTWEFYLIWLLPLFLVAFLAPSQALPGGPARWLALVALLVAFVAINYPGDLYLFRLNDFFYHPDWVPGTWVEKRLMLYHKHLDAVLYLRLAAQLFLALSLAALLLWHRFRSSAHGAPAFTP